MAPSHGNVCPNLNISHTHQPRQMHACRKKEGKRGEKNEVRCGAKIIVSRLCPPERLREDDFLMFPSLPTSCKIQQRFSGTIILANKSHPPTAPSTSLSCTLRRMPMVGKPREICSIACEERETPASQYAVETESGFSRNILLPRVSIPFLLSCIAHVQRSEKWLVRGWVKFVPALA